MKRLWIIVFVAGIAIIAMSAFQYLGGPGKGDAAPDFALPALEGKVISLDDFHGRPFILHFWATWCDYCRHEFPSLVRLQRDFEKDGLVVLGISEDDPKDEDKVRLFSRTVDVNFPILMDTTGSVADEYGSYGMPETILVNREGVIVERFKGAIDWDSAESRELIESLVVKK